jgi:2-keto-4-pentenoate hydratase
VDGATIDHAALAELYAARRDRTPVDPLVERVPGFSPVDGYRVQEAFLDRLLADGDEIRGWKLGLTSRAMQTLLGVDSPDYSRVPAGFVVPPGGLRGRRRTSWRPGSRPRSPSSSTPR